MPNFTQLFINSKGQPLKYNNQTLVLVDRFPVVNGDKLKVAIEKTDSERRQGISIDITGSCQLNGKLFRKGKGVNMLFWEDTMPKQVELIVFTKKDYVLVKNIWENYSLTGHPSVDYCCNGAAMIIEEIENGRRYRCNDWDPDDDFDDIIFTVQKVQE